MARILVIGCGYVGGAFAERAVEAGHEVFGLRRNPQTLPVGILPLRADIQTPETLSCIPDGIDYVVYSVAPASASDDSYRSAYVDGLANVVALFRMRGVPLKRIVLTSSTGVYEQDDGEWVDEDSPTAPQSFTGSLIIEGEKLLLESGFPATVVRLGGIYGPGRFHLVSRIIAEKAGVIDSAPSYANLIHRDDCAGIILHIIDQASPDRLYIGVDCEPVDRRVLITWLAEQLRLPVRAADATPERSHRPRGNKRCRNDRLLVSGYRFLYPTYREGFGAVLP